MNHQHAFPLHGFDPDTADHEDLRAAANAAYSVLTDRGVDIDGVGLGYEVNAADSPDPIPMGWIQAAMAAGAHDEFVAFVAEYPESRAADTLETAISMDALDEFEGFAGSWAGSLWRDGVKSAGNPGPENRRRIRELFARDRWPTWMEQRDRIKSAIEARKPWQSESPHTYKQIADSPEVDRSTEWVQARCEEWLDGEHRDLVPAPGAGQSPRGESA